MTSPLSLLAPLAGTDPVTPAHAAADDPAAFAAALVAALQLLQAPPKVEETPSASGCEAESAPESEAPAEGDQQSADSSRPEVGAAGAVAVNVEGAEQASVPGGAQDARTALLPDAMLRLGREVLAEMPGDAGATGQAKRTSIDEAGGGCATDRVPVDLVSDEPALPDLVQSRGSRQKRSESRQTPRSEDPGAVDPTVTACAPRIGAASPGADTPGRAQEPRSEIRSFKPARRDAPTSSAPPAATAPPDPALAAPGAAAALLAGMVTATTPRVQPGETREPVHSPSPPPAPGSEAPQAMEADNNAARRAMVENGRLASQLAESLGDVNITEFHVTLGRGRSAGAPPVATESIEGDEPSTAAAAVPPGTKPDELDGPVPRGAPLQVRPLGDPVRSRSDQSAPGMREPRSEAAPLPAYVKQSLASVRIPLASANVLPDASLPQSGKAERGTPQPTLPVSRQELPAPTPAESKDRSAAVERPRPGEAATSDTTASASVVLPGLTERLTERGDGVGTRGSSEARNLPHDPPGSERPAGVADRVTLQVADAEGRQTRIRVSVLGDQVRAVIVPPDAESARQLERRMDDLQAALARQGFTGSKVSVQQAGQSAIEQGGTPAAAFATAGDTKGAASPGRDQPADDQRQGRGQREQQQPGDGHRHPNRRSRDQGAEHRRR